MNSNVNFENLVVEKVDSISIENKQIDSINLIATTMKIVIHMLCTDSIDGSLHRVNMTINEPKSYQFEILD